MAIKEEISAGGVLIRRINDCLEVALISVRHGKRWGFPKGRQEAGEPLPKTALREVEEETGLKGSILSELGSISFDFNFKNGNDRSRRHKVVHFFLMENIGGDITGFDKHEVKECRWFPIDEALARLSFDDEKGLLRESQRQLKGRALRGAPSSCEDK